MHTHPAPALVSSVVSVTLKPPPPTFSIIPSLLPPCPQWGGARDADDTGAHEEIVCLEAELRPSNRRAEGQRREYSLRQGTRIAHALGPWALVADRDLPSLPRRVERAVSIRWMSCCPLRPSRWSLNTLGMEPCAVRNLGAGITRNRASCLSSSWGIGLKACVFSNFEVSGRFGLSSGQKTISWVEEGDRVELNSLLV